MLPRINVLKQYESAYNERNNQKNDAYVREYVNHFTNGGYIPGIEMEYTLDSYCFNTLMRARSYSDGVKPYCFTR